MTNHIIQEVRDARAAIAAEHGYDHRRIFEWAKAAQAARQQKLGATESANKKARKASVDVAEQVATPGL